MAVTAAAVVTAAAAAAMGGGGEEGEGEVEEECHWKVSLDK